MSVPGLHHSFYSLCAVKKLIRPDLDLKIWMAAPVPCMLWNNLTARCSVFVNMSLVCFLGTPFCVCDKVSGKLLTLTCIYAFSVWE